MSVKFKNNIDVDGYASAEYLDLSTTTTHVVNAGEIAWNSADGTFDIGLLNGVTLQAGQEMHFYGKATEDISNGNAVMFAGVQGDHILIAKADAATINANPEYFMGVATQDFTTNEFGYVTAFGNVRGLNTVGYTLGSVLYYDSTTATDGLLTSTMPSAPNAKILVAAVVRVHSTQGILMVRPHTMPKISDIQDVNTSLSKTTPIDADSLLLQDSADSSIWKKLSWSNTKATLKTYFDTIYQSVLTNPVTGTGTTNYVPKFTGTSTVGNSQLFDNGTNVGIGTANPQYKNDVIGSIRATGSFQIGGSDGSGSQGQIAIVGSNTYFDYLGFLAFRQNFGASESMRITSAGNVGIGTSSPGYRMQIETTAAAVFLTKNTSSTSFNRSYFFNNNDIGIQFLNFGSAYAFGTEFSVGVNGSVIQSNTTSAFAVGTSGAYPLLLGTNGTERMRITSAGNVGIGTSSPLSPLDVQTNSSALGINIRNRSGDDFSNLIFSQYNGSTYNAGIGWASSRLRIMTGGIGDAYERLTITSTGRVGIGTSSPSGRLQVSSATAGDDQIWLQSTTYTGGYSTLGYNANTGEFRIKQNDGGSAGITFYTGASASEKMRITPSGNVGIGTTNPTTRFQVGELFKVTSDAVTTWGSTNSMGILSWDTNLAIIGGLANTAVQFRANNAEVMRLTTSGRVGIGTTTPYSILDAQDYTSFLSLSSSINSEATTPDQQIGGIDFRKHYSLTIGASIRQLQAGGTSNYSNAHLAFYTNNGSVAFGSLPPERMRLTENGYLGIGTTSPGALLDVNGDALINGLTVGRGSGDVSTNTVLGAGALALNTGGSGNNIVIGHAALGLTSSGAPEGATVIGVDSSVAPDTNFLGNNCLSITQFNPNNSGSQVPHIYVPDVIQVNAGQLIVIASFNNDYYAGAFIEYVIRLTDGSDFAAGTVTTAWKGSGSGNLNDNREVIWTTFMDNITFILSGTNIELRNDSASDCWIRISVRAIMNQ